MVGDERRGIERGGKVRRTRLGDEAKARRGEAERWEARNERCQSRGKDARRGRVEAETRRCECVSMLGREEAYRGEARQRRGRVRVLGETEARPWRVQLEAEAMHRHRRG